MTLIELVVAVAILSLAALAGWRSFHVAGESVGTQAMRALAHEVALNRAAELQLLGLAEGRGLPATVAMGPVAWQVTLSETATRAGHVLVEIAVSAPQQPGARLSVFVRPEAAR